MSCVSFKTSRGFDSMSKKPDHPIKGLFCIEGPFLFCTYSVICSVHLTLSDNCLFVMNPVWSESIKLGIILGNLCANVLPNSFWSTFNEVIGLCHLHCDGYFPSYCIIVAMEFTHVSGHISCTNAQLKALCNTGLNRILQSSHLHPGSSLKHFWYLFNSDWPSEASTLCQSLVAHLSLAKNVLRLFWVSPSSGLYCL